MVQFIAVQRLSFKALRALTVSLFLMQSYTIDSCDLWLIFFIILGVETSTIFHNNVMTGAIHSFTLLPVDRTNDLAKPHQMCIESNKILLAIRTHYKGIKDDIITKHFIALFRKLLFVFCKNFSHNKRLILNANAMPRL